MPILKSPIHFSYQLMLGQYAERAADLYFATALQMCALTRTAPSLLLHPLDFLGADDDADLAFFPGMRLGAERKLRLMERLLDRYAAQYRIVAMHEHAAEAARGALDLRIPAVRASAA